jgi:hypothetical protein
MAVFTVKVGRNMKYKIVLYFLIFLVGCSTISTKVDLKEKPISSSLEQIKAKRETLEEKNMIGDFDKQDIRSKQEIELTNKLQDAFAKGKEDKKNKTVDQRVDMGQTPYEQHMGIPSRLEAPIPIKPPVTNFDDSIDNPPDAPIK